ncbi:hypothetical protein IKT18_03065 [Candidatus Saccharibacteria bacterium]|nr:hypothetical protein [Candidatus Saccharibacteria bacterium]
MKKLIIAILALVLLVSCIGCSKSGSYKYAENYKFTAYNNVASDEFWTTLSVNSSEADIGDLLGLIERIFQRDFGKLNMNWDNLMRITKAMQVAMDVGDMEDAPSDISYGAQFYCATCNTEVGEMYLFPGYFSAPEKRQLQALTHVLTRAALSTETDESSQIREGLAEYYTSKFMDNVGYKMEETIYPHQMTAAIWLIAVFGEDTVVNAAREDRLEELIDSNTRPGMGAKLEEALNAINLGGDQNRATNAIYDILANVTVGAGKKLEDVDYLLDYVNDLSKLEGTKIDSSYMRKVLQGKA